ncbi:MAG: site-specific DNA-methyltransferase [Calditrichaeota bacterium]|jgi:adenine-specific DNA-methyltransferase|nr:site-specific DNA-methyltransferase [Calditrichota bacterium]
MNDKIEEQELPLGLYWKGKRTTVNRIVLPFQSLEVIETINESRATREKEKGTFFRTNPNSVDTSWRNKLIWGDNKYVMNALLEKYTGQIDLIYIDPPFATGADFSTTVSIGDDEIEHTKEASAMEELAYRDTWGDGMDSFLQMMYDRLVLIRELLNERGSLYVHLDWRMAHYVKCILDEIFGVDNFRNDLRWRRQPVRGAKATGNQFARNSDIVLFYSKTAKYLWNNAYKPYSEEFVKTKFRADKNGRMFRDSDLGDYSTKSIAEFERQGKIYITKNGKKRLIRYLDEEKGEALGDMWSDIPEVNSQAAERLDYPTQKPEALLERIIKASSNDGDLIADFFGGSGTTAAVAEKLGRRWITSDLGRFAIHTSKKRFLEIQGCKPFEILNIGKYERQAWQTVSFGKKGSDQTLAEYLDFILKLFKAEALPGSAYIHGKKGGKLVHVGGVDAPVTLSDIQNALEETRRMKQKELVVLGWEWEMGLHDVVEREADKAGIKLHLLSIPREAMDKRAVDAGDIHFFELAYLETEVLDTKHGYQIKLNDFIIPNLDLVPEEVKKLVKKWSDYIDYWSVDWDYKNDTFHNQWQSYRTKKDRTLELTTDPKQYDKKGDYKVMVKVIDIFGNDTTHILDLKYR